MINFRVMFADDEPNILAIIAAHRPAPRRAGLGRGGERSRGDILFHSGDAKTMTDQRADILLVEDNPNDVKLTLHAFKAANLANAVHVARDGVEALEFLFAPTSDTAPKAPHRIKLILLDLKLPRLDGLEVLRRHKQDPRTLAIPVVVLTSSSEERDVMRTYEVGANSYIVKPVDFEQFTEAVRDIGNYWLAINHTQCE
jgi:two-component system response regulator